MNYDEKEFKSVSSGDLGIDFDEDQEKDEEENVDLFESIKEILKGKVKDVRVSKRLKNHPVCLANEGEVSIEMEKILNQMPNGQEVKAEKVLEINVHHEVFETLKDAFENDKEKLEILADVLYNQALLIEGLAIEDPVAYANNIWKMMH